MPDLLVAAPRPYVLWSQYTAVVRRRWALIAVLMLGGLGAGVAGAAIAPRTWAASASVLVTPTGVGVNNPNAGRAPAGVNLDIEAKLAVSESTLNRARAKLGDVGDLADRLEISVPPNSAILRFSYTAPTPSRAAEGANALAAAYLEERRAGAEAARKEELARLRTALAKRTEQLRRRTATAPPNDRLDAEREVLTRLVAAETRRIDALSSAPITPGTALDPATPPSRPVAPDLGVWATSGFSAGLLAAVGLALLRDRLSRRIRREDDIVRVHGLRVFATLPADARRDDQLGAAAFAHATTELMAVLPPGERLITVASATPGAPTGLAAAALAAALTHAGNEVLLVYTQLIDDPLARSLGAGSLGLSAIVLDTEQPDQLAQPVPGIEGLRVLGPGAEAVDAAERFVDPADPSIESLTAGVDYVVVAAGSALTTPEAGPLAARSDGTLLTVRLRGGTHGQLRQALRRVAPALVLGVLACSPNARAGTRSRPLTSAVGARQGG